MCPSFLTKLPIVNVQFVCEFCSMQAVGRCLVEVVVSPEAFK